MIGDSPALYTQITRVLREVFLRTSSVQICTLRADLIMTLHDAGVSTVCNSDPAHKFVWCLDACIRDGIIDQRWEVTLQLGTA